MNVHPRQAYRPNKPAKPNTAKYAVRSVIDQMEGPKRVAALLGRQKSIVHAWADPDSAAEMSFSFMCTLAGEGATAGAEYLAECAGGVFMPLKSGDEPLEYVIARSAIEGAEVVSRTLLARADKHLSASEGLQILKEISDQQCSLATARARVLEELGMETGK